MPVALNLKSDICVLKVPQADGKQAVSEYAHTISYHISYYLPEQNDPPLLILQHS